MKSRISTTIWTLVILNGVALFAVLGLAYSAGRQAAVNSTGFDATGLIIPGVVALSTTIILAWKLGGGILSPVSELAEFSERLAAGDGKARADVSLQRRVRLHRGEPESCRRQSLQGLLEPGSQRVPPAQHHRSARRSSTRSHAAI